jgi:hypothetical protein
LEIAHDFSVVRIRAGAGYMPAGQAIREPARMGKSHHLFKAPACAAWASVRAGTRLSPGCRKAVWRMQRAAGKIIAIWGFTHAFEPVSSPKGYPLLNSPAQPGAAGIP